MGRRLTVRESSREYRKGLLWTGLGVLCLTPDALLVRLIDCDPWTLLFWRGTLMSISFSLFLAARRIPVTGLQGKGWLAALFLSLSTTCFVFSLQSTDAANTLVILATSPLLAAVASRLFLKERLPLATWAATVVALGGVAVSLLDGAGRGSLRGELFALGGAICMASHFTTLRWWRSPNGPLSIWAAGWLIGLLSLPMASPLSPRPQDWPWIVLLGGLLLPAAFGMMAVGPRYLPAPEVGLLLLGETVLGPFWVWLAMGEKPGQATAIGGLVVITTLVAHSLRRRRAGPAGSAAP